GGGEITDYQQYIFSSLPIITSVHDEVKWLRFDNSCSCITYGPRNAVIKYHLCYPSAFDTTITEIADSTFCDCEACWSKSAYKRIKDYICFPRQNANIKL
ncbi:MAG: hypothetical protein IKV28_01960, partial [Bacteroidales bacterium]|nr:hypothetical protein [Bacteroidales bacterium]